MNLRRGLFRAWLVGSVIWIGVSIWRLDFSCFFATYPWCKWWVVSPWLSSTHLGVLAITFGVPIAAFILGVMVSWVTKGFHN